jgi:hypothetical protein
LTSSGLYIAVSHFFNWFHTFFTDFTVFYLEIIEDNNNELAQFVKKNSEMLSALESEEVIDNLDKLKQDLLHFLNFDELTPEILHR